MKITTILFVIALVAIVAALIIPSLLASRRHVIRLNRHARVRPFTLIERFALPCVQAMSAFKTRAHDLLFGGGNRIALANAILTHPACGDTALADEAIGRFALLKAGSDIYHKALCDAADIPIGFTRDASAAAAEDRFAFDYLALAHKGTEFTASGAVTAGNFVCPGANGTVRDVTLLSGATVYICGQAVTSAMDGAQVVVIPCAPVQRVIA